MLIVAGDVASGMGQIEAVLRLLTAAYDDVLLCVGNHELWVAPDGDSLQKLRDVHALAAECGARTGPVRYHCMPPPASASSSTTTRSDAGGGANKQNENEKNRQQRRSRPPAPAAAWSLAGELDLLERDDQWSHYGGDGDTSTAAEGDGDGGGGTVTHDDAPSEVVIFPLLSWYHASWDTEPDLTFDASANTTDSSSSRSDWNMFLNGAAWSFFLVW